ncbi:MAG: glycoside hydrolase family 2 TIM barrel-domain containing protein [Verrucomicrobiota bacterium]
MRIAILLLALTTLASATPIKVELIDGKLHRGGEPYQIKGAGGDTALELLAQSGGNSIRTWGVDGNTQQLLDDAHANGLSVCLGIWIGQVRQGFNYQDYDQVAQQIDLVLDAVRKYKDHPAVLMWGIGNEMEAPDDGENPALWHHIDFLAREVKAIDPNHPTITVIAEMGGRKIEAMDRLCPNIDIIGVNSYGGVSTLFRRYRGSRPVVVTEFGPPGVWEMPKNEFGSVNEWTSTEKGKIYKEVYSKFTSDPKCLGSYAFIWGAKEEFSSTWFGMLLPSGERLAAADAMSELWSGAKPKNLCPQINKLELTSEAMVKPGGDVAAILEAKDAEGAELRVEWILAEDPQNYGGGGDFQAKPLSFPDAIVENSGTEVKVKMPENGGTYRLYAYVYDNAGGAAVGNISLKVDGPRMTRGGAATNLPLVIYTEPDQPETYWPSGYMGNSQAIEVDAKSTDNPRTGKHCMRAHFSANEGWGGVVWQNPPNDWGDQPGGYDLTGAQRLSFWARGAKGGEMVNFAFGLIGNDKPYFDTARLDMQVTLDSKWTKYSLPLNGNDLTRIKSAFAWVVESKGEEVVFFLDDIVVE